MTAIGSIRYAAVLALPALVACYSAPHMMSERDEAVPVPHHATWAWAAPDTAHSDWQRDPALASEITEQRFRRAFDSVMADMHFEQVDDPDSADFTLAWHIGVHRGSQQAAGPVMAHSAVSFGVMVGGPGYGWGPGFGAPLYHRGYGYGAYPAWGWGAGLYAWPGWGWGSYGPPAVYGHSTMMSYAAQYGMGALGAVLRSTNNGDVAWEGTYLIDPYEMQNVTQHHVHDIVAKLMDKLRK